LALVSRRARSARVDVFRWRDLLAAALAVVPMVTIGATGAVDPLEVAGAAGPLEATVTCRAVLL
jgi:hypothetical protein